MKKLLSLKPAGILIFAGLSLAMIMGSFWHYQNNQTQLGRLSVLGQGLTTCFNRVSQTFTAMMISDLQSTYVKSDFMNISDECLSETANGSRALRTSMGRAYENLNQLISEAHWFHEKIGRVKNAKEANATLAPISDRYGRMENYKQTLMDEIDGATLLIRKVQRNDEFLMGAGLIMFVIALAFLSLQEYQRYENKRAIEREALSYLTAGQGSIGAIVDRLVEKALMSQAMPVTAQIFRDYHGDILERQATRISSDEPKVEETIVEAAPETYATPLATETLIEDIEKASLKEVLVTLQNVHTKDNLHIAELRDVQLLANGEGVEHMLNAAVNALLSKRTDDRKIMVGTQVHSDRVVLNFFCGGNVFTATELEYASNPEVIAEGLDMNLQILKEMVQVANAKWYIENKVDRHGNITGMNIRLVMDRAMKENRPKNLVSVMKGKKRDLAKTINH
jgi:hypothetical protein